MGQVMARAVLVGEDGCVLLAQLLASFLLVDGAAGASLSHSSKSRVSQIGEGEAEATGQGRPVAAACRSRKRRRRAHHRSTLRRHITAATTLGHAPCSRLVIHTRTGDVSMLPLCLVAHLATSKGSGPASTAPPCVVPASIHSSSFRLRFVRTYQSIRSIFSFH